MAAQQPIAPPARSADATATDPMATVPPLAATVLNAEGSTVQSAAPGRQTTQEKEDDDAHDDDTHEGKKHHD